MNIIKTVIFGNKDFAKMAWFVMTTSHSSLRWEFTCEEEYIDHEFILKGRGDVWEEKAVSWDKLEDVGDFIAPISDVKTRERIHKEAIERGYQFCNAIHRDAIVNGEVGDNCMILELNNIQMDAVIGDGCILWSGNHIGHGTTIGDFSTITSHVCIGGHAKIGKRCYIGMGAIIRDHVTICDDVTIGQGANVVKDIIAPGTYIGNPAKRVE